MSLHIGISLLNKFCMARFCFKSKFIIWISVVALILCVTTSIISKPRTEIGKKMVTFEIYEPRDTAIFYKIDSLYSIHLNSCQYKVKHIPTIYFNMTENNQLIFLEDEVDDNNYYLFFSEGSPVVQIYDRLYEVQPFDSSQYRRTNKTIKIPSTRGTLGQQIASYRWRLFMMCDSLYVCQHYQSTACDLGVFGNGEYCDCVKQNKELYYNMDCSPAFELRIGEQYYYKDQRITMDSAILSKIKYENTLHYQ